jgi:hypothetical protein
MRSATTSFWHITMPSGAVHPNTYEKYAPFRFSDPIILGSA